MIRYLLILCTLASATVRSTQDLVDLVGQKGVTTHFYDLYQRAGWVTPYEFGAKGNGIANDAGAINAALASRPGAKVFLPAAIYRTTATVNVPAGASLFGVGPGVNPLQPPTAAASTIRYYGTGTAVSVNGSNASVGDLAIAEGNSPATAAEGLLLNGDSLSVESAHFQNLLVFGFKAGTGIRMIGIDTGSVAYCDFINIRVRNAKVGIGILDSGSAKGFVNTNQFIGGAISGDSATFDYALHATGGNDNRFYGMSVEPYNSTYGHIVIDTNALGTGSIWFDGRIEAAFQHTGVPFVRFGPKTKDSYITTSIGITGYIDNQSCDKCNRVFDFGTKSPQFFPSTPNLFLNDNWEGYSAGDSNTATGIIPNWTTLESGGAGKFTTFNVTAAEKVEDAKVLAIRVPAGVTFHLRQVPSSNTFSSGAPLLFGAWVKTSAKVDVQMASFNTDGTHPATVAGTGYDTSASHLGTWQQLGGRQDILTASTVIRQFISIPNTTGEAATVYITGPVLNRGYQLSAVLPTTGTGPYARQDSPNFTGTMGAATITATGTIGGANLTASSKLGVGQAVGTLQAEITAASKSHLKLQGSQIPWVEFRTNSGSAAARNWALGADVNAFGDFLAMRSSSNSTAPSDALPIFGADASDNFTIAAGDVKLLTAGKGVTYQAGPKDLAGSGSPEGVVTATVGSTFRRSDGGAGTSFYVKESGSGNTGWVAK